MQLIIQTQYKENYEFDKLGNSVMPGYWKFKGGSRYGMPIEASEASKGNEHIDMLVNAVKAKIEHFSAYSMEYVIEWRLVDEDSDEMTNKEELEWNPILAIKS